MDKLISYSQIEKMQIKILKNIRNLNDGGCCRFAYYFSERLKELGIEHSIYFCSDYYYHLFSTLKDFETPQHVFVHIKGIGFIDGYATYQSGICYSKKVKIQYSVKKALKAGNWNTLYDVSQDKTLKKIIYETIK